MDDNKYIRIGFSGPHSSGKTTLLEKLKYYKDLHSLHPLMTKNLYKKDVFFEKSKNLKYFTILPEITRKVAEETKCLLNEQGTLETRIILTSKHIETLMINKNSNFIMNRTLLDVYAYTKYFTSQKYHKNPPLPSWIEDFIVNVAYTYLPLYSCIFYIPFELKEIQNDGIRSTDKEFHRCVCDSFEEIVNNFQNQNLPFKIIPITGTIEERLEKVLNEIDNLIIEKGENT